MKNGEYYWVKDVRAGSFAKWQPALYCQPHTLPGLGGGPRPARFVGCGGDCEVSEVGPRIIPPDGEDVAFRNVTGRQLIEHVTGDARIAQAIYDAGFVCVPKDPTAEMIHQARYDALHEDARAVWETMVSVSEGDLKEPQTLDY